MTKYYLNANGDYLGGFQDAKPPVGAIEIAEPPENGADIWTGSGWDKSARPLPEKSHIELAIEAIADSLPMANDRANIHAILKGKK